jgi:hypothetical protein
LSGRTGITGYGYPTTSRSKRAGTTSSPRSTRWLTFLILRTWWPACTGRFGEYVTYRRMDPSGAAQQIRVLLDQLVLTSRPRRFIRRQNWRLAAPLWQTAR